MVLLSRFDRSWLIPQCTSVELCHCPFAGKVELLKWGWDKARQPHSCRSGVQAARGWLGCSSTTDSFFLSACRRCRRTRWAKHTVKLERKEMWVLWSFLMKACDEAFSLLLPCGPVGQAACSWLHKEAPVLHSTYRRAQLSISCSNQHVRWSSKLDL